MSNKVKRMKGRVKSTMSKSAMMYLFHFGERRDFDNISCLDCADLKAGACAGKGFTADQCLECMEKKAFAGDVWEMGEPL